MGGAWEGRGLEREDRGQGAGRQAADVGVTSVLTCLLHLWCLGLDHQLWEEVSDSEDFLFRCGFLFKTK